MFLGLTGRVNTIFCWSPASAYTLIDTPLWNCTNPDIRGHIIQGEKDDCARCNPEFTQTFIDNNQNVSVDFVAGLDHDIGYKWNWFIDQTIDWFSELWNLSVDSSHIIPVFVGSSFLVVFLVVFVIVIRRKMA
jgi:hypothetical protein